FERRVGREEQAEAVMFCDMTLLLRYRGFLVAATNVMTTLGSEITMQRIDEIAPLATTIAQGDPMPISNISMGNIENGFDSFIMPGIVILILQQAIILAIGMAGGAKRERPELIGYNPVNTAPSYFITMMAQMTCYITILIVPIIFLIHYIPLIFAFPMAGSNLQIFAFIIPLVLASCGVGFMIQGVVRERESIFVIWVVTSVIFLFLSGLTWPRYAMGPVWTLVSDLIPATWGVEGFIRMNTNGATISQVAPCYTALWIQAAVYLALGYVVQRWVVRPAERRALIRRSQYLS
ncbi:MAG: ABC transporter permease, partial [Muribaculaceae bacterium]|nr:ABC transporter permease [Muribaculaceae bacterium]